MADERYDYQEAVTDDIRDYFAENEIHLKDYADRDELFEQVRDRLWTCDSVTGNASGSYFCNAWKAEECICHNLDLLTEALNELGGDLTLLENGAETCDVLIRCYLLDQCLNDVIDELEEEENYAGDEEDEEEDEDENL